MIDWEEVNRLLVVKNYTFEYRLFYDEYGTIIHGTTLDTDEINGNYLVVSKEQFSESYRYRVIDGELVNKKEGMFLPKKSNKGFRVVKYHVGLLLNDEENIESEYYEW